MTNASRRSLVAIAGVTFVVLVGCDATNPDGISVNHETRPCPPGGANSAWTSNSLQLNVTKPPCPFIIKSTQSEVTYGAVIEAPANKIGFSYPGGPVLSYITAYVLKLSTATEITSSHFIPFVPLPGYPSIYRALVDMSGFPGWYLESADPTMMLDSLHVEAGSMASGGFPSAWKRMPGRINAGAQDIIGPNAIATGQLGTWRSYTQWDTTAYTYRWIVDGQEVVGAVGNTYSRTLSAGAHTIANVTIRADDSRDTASVNVKAFNGAIAGPASVKPFASCSWSASASGGSAPYGFSWSAPGGTGSTSWFEYQNGASNGESFTIQVGITDATGAQIWISRQVQVRTTAPQCPS